MAVEALTKRERHLPVEQRASRDCAVAEDSALGIGEWLEVFGFPEHVNAFRALLVDTTRDLAVLSVSKCNALLHGVNTYWAAQGVAVLGSPVLCLDGFLQGVLRGAWEALGGETHCEK